MYFKSPFFEPKKLEAGDKPSTWFPPEALAELSIPESVPERYDSMKIYVFHTFVINYIMSFLSVWTCFLRIQFF